MRYFEGENLNLKSIADRKKLIGKTVKYLRKRDIDRSGRGYFFPQLGTVTDVKGKNIEFDNVNFEYCSDIVEMIEVKP